MMRGIRTAVRLWREATSLGRDCGRGRPHALQAASANAACGPLRASVAVLMLAGCVTAVDDRFYTLGPAHPARSERGAAPGSAAPAAAAPTAPFRVVVATAAVPEMLDRPQLVLHTGGHRVDILEHQRWAEPLGTGIARAIADRLELRWGEGRAHLEFAPGLEEAADIRVRLAVDRFDSILGARDAVDDEIHWTVSCAGAGATAGSGMREGFARLREDMAPAAERRQEMLVAAHARLLERFAGSIAAAAEALAPYCTGPSRARGAPAPPAAR